MARASRLRGLTGLLLLVTLSACERGCLATWLRGHGLGEVPTAPTIPKGSEAACPEGLARCRDGVVEVSRAYTPPGACSPEGCRCPWDRLITCKRGCVVDGMEMEMPRENAEKQLCAGDIGPAVARPAPPGFVPDGGPADPEVLEAYCEVERFHCAQGTLYRCDSGQAKPVVQCQGGCVQGEALVVEDISVEAATALLCVR